MGTQIELGKKVVDGNGVDAFITFDGDACCAVRKDFINLQESPYGFGADEMTAIEDLILNEALGTTSTSSTESSEHTQSDDKPENTGEYKGEMNLAPPTASEGATISEDREEKTHERVQRMKQEEADLEMRPSKRPFNDKK